MVIENNTELESLTIIENLKQSIANIEEKYFYRNERDFSYELYYRVRNKVFPLNVEVTCETPKNRFSFTDKIFNDSLIRKCFLGNNLDIRNINRFPDLVVHKYDSLDAQHLAIEIKKTISKELILKDLAKLVVYCRGKLKYKKGILIIINPFRTILAIPSVKEILIKYEEIEIWIVKPNEEIIILNNKNLNL